MRSMLRPLAMLAAGVCCALALGTSLAQEAKPPTDRELRSAMNRAEKRFFDLYNEVNVDVRHEMTCGNEDRAGSRLRKSRTCRTQGEADISADAAKEYLRGLDLAAEVDAGAVRGQPQAGISRDSGGPVAQRSAPEPSGSSYTDQASDDPASRIQAQRAAFDQHLGELIAKHPELKQRLDEYLLARARYEARQK